LSQLADHQPTATISLGRELTKMHEELLVGSAADLLELLQSTPVKQKGEFVMMIDTR
jgi:16S rRNA C1402 (ribose-2'-O) methylase RsmI